MGLVYSQEINQLLEQVNHLVSLSDYRSSTAFFLSFRNSVTFFANNCSSSIFLIQRGNAVDLKPGKNDNFYVPTPVS